MPADTSGREPLCPLGCKIVQRGRIVRDEVRAGYIFSSHYEPPPTITSTQRLIQNAGRYIVVEAAALSEGRDG